MKADLVRECIAQQASSRGRRNSLRRPRNKNGLVGKPDFHFRIAFSEAVIESIKAWRENSLSAYLSNGAAALGIST
jgi:hypothetical protein